MRLDDKLTLPVRDLTEQTAKRSLRAGVKVYFRLLQKEQRRRVWSQQLGYRKQRLADAISDVNEIAQWAL